ncbi:oxygen-independent coproporphyrinogen III oxidase [Crassaminicella thermophila]|uniref:Heme chaperone HemW n=1 Tax=Crassaminicella thermophila TaxID=2599308 RepID=A0A5C0SEK5_CRATE|nr:radical SAM family heme chaperone HemW [Crassaminicella thermophila]QEK12372.1 oxygen-independent coproporphyrinogen III oxidase [Crassaminicella thermophila]
MKEIGMYIHIPFCAQKCLYCDFCSFSATEEMISKYIDALIKEMKIYEEKLRKCKIKSIFIGGGTPSIISINKMDKIINGIHSNFNLKEDLEFSIESNPGTLNKEKISYYLNHNINRLSIGLQAWQDFLLKKLGRVHNSKEFVRNYLLAREIGFKNINIDIMFALPNQSINHWQETLRNVVTLKPEHISAYSLKIEEGTVFNQLYKKGELHLPDEEKDRKMYHFTIDYLLENGYKHYEISNFAKEGQECIHNKIYWENEEYIGLGLGAHSYLNKIRYSNTTDLKDYIENIDKKNICVHKEEISIKDEIAETMFLGLRMMKGISIKKFTKKFGISPLKVYSNEICDLKEKGLLQVDDQVIRLTRKGIDLSNHVFVAFLLD